jgi:hypothetical protein
MRNFRRVFFSARSAGAKMSFALEIELREAAIADAILHWCIVAQCERGKKKQLKKKGTK